MKDHPLEDLRLYYLSEKDIKLGTYELYDTVLKQYIHYLKARRILYASTKDIEAYKQSQLLKNYKASWIHTQINIIKNFYKYLKLNQRRLEIDKVYLFDVAEPIMNKKSSTKEVQTVLTASEVKHILHSNEISRKYIWHYRNYAIIYLMLTTGMRSVEVRRAKIADLSRLNDISALYIQGKGRDAKDQYVKLTPGVRESLLEYLAKRKDKNPYMFISHSYHTKTLMLSRPSLLRILKDVLALSGLDRDLITPHALRHTAATLNLMRGASLESTRRFLRHSNLTTTRIYAHDSNRLEDDSESAIEKYILGENT